MAIAISISLSSLSAISLSLQDEIKQDGHTFFILFLVCTLLVIVGVVLEEIEFRVEKSYVDEDTGSFHPEKRKALATLGLWLLVIGIAGEGLFEIARSWTDGLLQDVSNSLLLNAEAQTGNAAKSAKIARIESESALASATKARDSSSHAMARAESAGKTVDAVNEQLAKIRAWREIKPDKQAALCKVLSTYNGTSFDLYVSTDEEAVSLMRTIKSILSCAKWIQAPASGSLVLTGESPSVGITGNIGIVLEVSASRTDLFAAIQELSLELGGGNPVRGESAHLDDVRGDVVLAGSEPKVEPNAIHVFVGKKPL